MSDSTTTDSTAPRVTTESKGVAIEKTFAADEFDTPAIVLSIENGRSSPVSMRVVDPLPEELDQSDIGFHPEYAAEGWTRREDGDLQLDRELGAGESIKSVYGIRLSEVQDPASLLREPEIDEVVEIEEADAGASGDAAASAEEIDQAIPDAEDEAGADAGAETDPGPAEDITEPAAGDDAGRDRPRKTAGETVDALVTPTTDGESVAAALAAELERGSVEEDTIRTLNEHLSPRLAESSQVRLDDVQSRLADLEAYTDALEGILDTQGTDEDITRTLATIGDDIERVAAQTDAIRADLDDAVEDVEETDADLADLEEELDAEVDDVRAEIESVGDAVDDVDGRLDELGDQVDDMEAELDEALGGIEGSIDDVRADLEASIEEVREDMEDLVEWRDDFIGAVGAGDDEEE